MSMTQTLVVSLIFSALVFTSGCQSPVQLAESPNGMAATAHPLATKAAREILERGGNAADAAIAAGFVLAVVEPTMNSIGGRSQILVRAGDGDFHAYNGMTEVPASYVRPEEAPSNGYGTIATPGVLAALNRLHQEHGSLPLSELMSAAIAFAEDGFSVLPGESARQSRTLKAIQDNPGFRRSFVKPDGSVSAPGETLRQQDLAKTLRRLSSVGVADFYQGEIAQAIVEDMSAQGGFVTAEDLASYRVLDGRMVHTNYRGFGIHRIAAPAGGGLVVKALNILEQFELSSMTEQQWAAVVAQALSLSVFSMSYDYEETDLKEVESKVWARDQAALIVVPDMAAVSATDEFDTPLQASTDWLGETWGPDSHHTTHFSMADCNGMLVSITQTLGPAFGSKVITPGLGFVYATTMGTYLSESDSVPGSRPRTTIAPTVVTKDGETVMVLGAAGGLRILSAIVQTISRFVDQGLTLNEAVRAPRVHPKRGDGDAAELLKFSAEQTAKDGWLASDIQAWQDAGFDVEGVPRSGAFGRVHAIARSDHWIGVADPDWEGSAAAPKTSSSAR